MIPWGKSEKNTDYDQITYKVFATHLFNTTYVNTKLRRLILCVLTANYLTNWTSHNQVSLKVQIYADTLVLSVLTSSLW